MPVECGVRACIRMRPGLDPRDPAGGRQPGDVACQIGPRRSAVARELKVAVVGPDPDRLRVARALRDLVDRRVHLRGRVVDRDAAGLLLLLLMWVILRVVSGYPLSYV